MVSYAEMLRLVSMPPEAPSDFPGKVLSSNAADYSSSMFSPSAQTKSRGCLVRYIHPCLEFVRKTKLVCGLEEGGSCVSSR